MLAKCWLKLKHKVAIHLRDSERERKGHDNARWQVEVVASGKWKVLDSRQAGSCSSQWNENVIWKMTTKLVNVINLTAKLLSKICYTTRATVKKSGMREREEDGGKKKKMPWFYFHLQLTFKVLIDVVNDFLILALTTRIQQVHVVAETLLLAHIGVLRIDFAYVLRDNKRARGVVKSVESFTLICAAAYWPFNSPEGHAACWPVATFW